MRRERGRVMERIGPLTLDRSFDLEFWEKAGSAAPSARAGARAPESRCTGGTADAARDPGEPSGELDAAGRTGSVRRPANGEGSSGLLRR